ncbi:MAG TPA: DUF4870 domain-containing protein [Paucimonas sp.]|nr:DUF4870 domain-containing protein [Paucimonas sp.]HJW56561.1 DUF4870 domain-containing protein [Burkholderiaceae bacterium]
METLPQLGPTKDECNLAMLSHLLGVFTGFIGALIIWLIKKDEVSFAAEEAREALNFQITIAIAMFAAWMLAFLLIGFLIIPVLFVTNFIFCIIGAVSASKGRPYRYPFTLRLVK